MPKVEMRATRDFSYSTRRLKAGDTFPARNEADARILVLIKRAERMRQPGRVAAPPPGVAVRAASATPPADNTFTGFLDRSVADISADLEKQDTAALNRYLAAERRGKSRKTLVAAIEAELDGRTA